MLKASERSVDDLLRKVFTELLKSKSRVNPTKGENGEIFGALLELKNPRARLSRTESRSIIDSCIGEFLWYMAQSNSLDYIQYFIPAYHKFAEFDGTVNGAYGPRLFNKNGINQVAYVIEKLKANSDSRKAVIQLYDAKDSVCDFNDVPCTCTLQFVLRRGFLHMLAHMRSNDAYLGLPHDIFCFTMLQELIAGSLNAKLGSYLHSVGSLHLYTKNARSAAAFLDEGIQDDIPMPSMPPGDQWEQINKLLETESKIRAGEAVDTHFPDLNYYWADIARLLAVKAEKNRRNIVRIKSEMQSSVYETYIRKKRDKTEGPSTTADIFSTEQKEKNA